MGQAKEHLSGGGAYVLRSLPTSTEKGGHDVHVKPTWTYLISSAIQSSDMIKLFFVVYGMLCQKAKQHLRATSMSFHHHQCSMRETHLNADESPPSHHCGHTGARPYLSLVDSTTIDKMSWRHAVRRKSPRLTRCSCSRIERLPLYV